MDFTNPLPFTLGGGPTDIESTWLTMREMVGGEHGPGPIGGVDDLARQARATSIAGAERAIERAFLQHFPALATDALPLYEALYQTDGANNDTALRALLVVAWLPPEGATTPSLAASLTAISAKLSVSIEDADKTIVTVPGKYFAPEDNEPPFGLTSPVAHTSAVLPNYATRDILRVVYTLAAGEIAMPDDVVRDVEKLLQKRLPSWQTWTLTQLSFDLGAGFYLDGGAHGESVLDFTAL